MFARFDRHFQLGAHTVGGGYQKRVAQAGGFEVEQRAETAELRVGAAAARGLGERLDGVDQRVAGIDVDACLAVPVAAGVAGNGALVRNWPAVRTGGNILDLDLFSMAEPRPTMWTMLLRVALLLVLVAGVSAGSRPAAAQAPSVFTVRNVTVDQTAATAAEAREAALIDGERKAFRKLLERLTPRAQQAQLPRTTNQQVAELIENFEVQSERASAVRYIATYTFRFNPDGVRALLRRANVPFSETYGRPLVVLPIYQDGDVAVLWDDPNPWLAAWRTLPPADGLQPLIVPLGDLTDIGLISTDQAQRGDAERIAAIANKYGAAGAVLVEAVVDRANPARPAVQTATTRFDGGGGDQTLVESYTAAAGEEQDALLARAAAQTANAIEEQWKSDVALQFGQEATLVTDVVFAALGDWVALRDRLADTAMIRRTEVLNLSRNRAQLELHYIGTESGLRLALAQKDLVLDHDTAGWQLTLRRAGASR
jgi:hypothetical protein